MLEVRKATLSEIHSIMNIIENARQIMIENGNLNQWINGYPSEEIIKNDIKNNQGYVVIKHDEIKGYFCFLKGIDPEPTYASIKEGKWLNNKPYGVIHRLASDGTTKGVADACFSFCFNQIQNIKVDTHEDNLIMQNYFNKLGFEYCGIITVSNGTTRKAFQKTI
nr:GNAT family N-acetyltransferase [uncultured Flavobacterium sp.]